MLGTHDEEILTTTHRITITWKSPELGSVVDVSAYVHLLWSDERGGNLVGINIDGLSRDAFAAKSILRMYCEGVTERLRCGEIDLEYICNQWSMRRFEPEGICIQTGRPAKSILDAASRILRDRYLGGSI